MVLTTTYHLLVQVRIYLTAESLVLSCAMLCGGTVMGLAMCILILASQLDMVSVTSRPTVVVGCRIGFVLSDLEPRLGLLRLLANSYPTTDVFTCRGFFL